MKKLHIFYFGFVTNDGSKITLGGVQTLLLNLSEIFIKRDYEVHFYRPSDMCFENCIKDIYVHGFKCEVPENKLTKRIKSTFQHYQNLIDKDNDIVLFADDLYSCKTHGFRTVALQHGIFWDVPNHNANNSSITYILGTCRKMLSSIKRLYHTTFVDMMICVDYNYVNWYRAVLPYPKAKLIVNPNFSQICPQIVKPTNSVNIIFARRFEPFRGTRIFCQAITKILNEYSNVNVTLAGWGSDEKWLHEQLMHFSNVTFTSYAAEDSLRIHADKHIAVVPTMGSEGTSLSLLEAMSAQCAVVGSDVGGITNIIIDGYNGIMIPAGDYDSLYNAIKSLIDDPEKRNRLAQTGYETIRYGFSHEKWEKNWNNIITEIESLSCSKDHIKTKRRSYGN